MRILVLDSIDNERKGNMHGRIVGKVIKQVNPNADITYYKVTDNGGYATSNMLCEGLMYAFVNHFDIINISLGLPFVSEEIKNVINMLCDYGTIICVASGNNWCSPLAELDNVISVGSCNSKGEVSEFTCDNYDVLSCGEVEVDGKIWCGSSFAVASYVGLLSKEK